MALARMPSSGLPRQVIPLYKNGQPLLEIIAGRQKDFHYNKTMSDILFIKIVVPELELGVL